MNENKIHKALDTIIILLIASLIFYSAFSWCSNPSEIPNHFETVDNGVRVIDFMSRNFLFFPALIGLILGIIIYKLGNLPEKFNYVVKITPKNKEIQYNMAKTIIRILNISTILIFFIMDYGMANTKKPTQIHSVLIVMAIIYVVYIVISIKNK